MNESRTAAQAQGMPVPPADANSLINVLTQQRNSASDAVALAQARYDMLLNDARANYAELVRLRAENDALKSALEAVGGDTSAGSAPAAPAAPGAVDAAKT